MFRNCMAAVIFLFLLLGFSDTRIIGQVLEVNPGLKGFHLPPGFVIEKVAGPPLVEHPMMGGFDDKGRLFLAESAGMNLKADELRKQLPNFIRVLEPADEKGFFHKSRVWADRMTFPMGALWHDGALYVASSGGLWKLEDTKGIGVADKRTELVTKFNYTGNAADIHGPFLGPDGRLYWCDGRHGHEITRPDGTVMKGKAARIFRSKTDGSELEVVCGGGMDNPVEIAFSPECEPFVTVDILHNQPARNDGIIYAIEGGVYPWHAVYKEFPQTGDLLPAVADLGWVAPSGLMRYRSTTFGKEYQGNLFSAQFNRHRIQRHILERDGAGFKAKTEDFLVCDDKNFHPTDVLEDADGSLLVIDTGGWFRIGCPTSKIAQPDIKGAIYRIRKMDAAKVKDPRGTDINWEKVPDLIGWLSLLGDDRFMVRDRALQEFARRGSNFLKSLEHAMYFGMKGPDEKVRKKAEQEIIWALTRMNQAQGREIIRDYLTTGDLKVRLAAIHSTGLHRDIKGLEKLIHVVAKDGHPAARRQAALALARLKKTQAVPPLMEAISQARGDRFLEHALIHALIQIGKRESLVEFLGSKESAVRRAALIALDQMPGGNLTQEMVTPLLQTDDPRLTQTVLGVIANRPGWGKDIVDLLDAWIVEPKLDPFRQDNLRSLVIGLSSDAAIQAWVARALEQEKTSVQARLIIIEAIGQAPLAKLPPSWLTELARTLNHPQEQVALQAAATVQSRSLGENPGSEFYNALAHLSRDPKKSPELRVAALGALTPGMKMGSEDLQFLQAQLAPEKAPLHRLAAANALGRFHLGDSYRLALVPKIATAGPLEMPSLLGVFEKRKTSEKSVRQASDPTPEELGRTLLKALDKAPGLAALTPAGLERVFEGYPEEIRKQASALASRLGGEGDFAKQKARLTELEPLLQGGEETRGRDIFFGPKAICAACHAVNNKGNRIGPDLTKIGAIRSGKDLLESLVFPSASFARGYETYVVETHAGKNYHGTLARETADAVFLVTAERVEIRLPRGDIASFLPGRNSIMPQGLDAQLSPQELRDLLAFLQSLR